MSPLLASAMVSGHKRPIPPPESRAFVLSQCAIDHDWISIDEDLQIAAPNKRLKIQADSATDAKEQRWATPPVFESETISELRYPISQPIQKRSLFQSEEARRAVQLSKLALGNTINQDTSDEGYGSFTYSPRSCDDSLTPQDNEDEWLRLAQLTSVSTTAASRGFNSDELSTLRINEFRDREEKEGEERSRKLRAQTLTTAQQYSSHGWSPVERELSESTSVDAHYDLTKLQKNDTMLESAGTDRLPMERSLEPVDHERLLDIAQHHVQGQPVASPYESGVSSESRTNSQISGPSPFSRAAAEEYRTQSRHLPDQVQLCMDNMSNAAHEAGARRLEHIKSSMVDKTGMIFETKVLHKPPESSTPNITAHSKQNWSTPISYRNSEHTADPDSVLAGPYPVNSPNVTRRPMLQGSQNISNAFEFSRTEPDHTGVTKAFPFTPNLNFDLYPVQGEDLSLPKQFNELDTETQQIIVRHETLKERLRDLDAAVATMQEIAVTGSSRPFQKAENQDLMKAKTFVNKVIIHGLSGRRQRAKINGVKDNMKRRSQKHDPPDPSCVQSYFDKLLKPDTQQQITDEKASLIEQIDSLGAMRSKAYGKRKDDHKAQKRASGMHRRAHHMETAICNRLKKETAIGRSVGSGIMWQDLPGGTLFDLSEPENMLPKRRKLRKRDREQRAAQDKFEADLRATIRGFDTEAANKTSNNALSIDDVAEMGPIDAESVTSEENEGAEHYAGAQVLNKEDHAVDLTTQDTHKPATPFERTSSKDSPIPTQLPHNALHQSLIKKNTERQLRTQKGARPFDSRLLPQNRAHSVQSSMTEDDNTNAEVEFDDVESQLSEEVDDQHIYCYRYKVVLSCIGLDDYDDSMEYLVGNYLQRQAANERAISETNRITERHVQSVDHRYDQFVEKRDVIDERGLRSCFVEFGRDGRATCKVYVEMEEYKPSKDAYENARVRRACQAPDIYRVLWTKTTKSIVDVDNAEAVANNHCDGHPENCGRVECSQSSDGEDTSTTSIGRGLEKLTMSYPYGPSQKEVDVVQDNDPANTETCKDSALAGEIHTTLTSQEDVVHRCVTDDEIDDELFGPEPSSVADTVAPTTPETYKAPKGSQLSSTKSLPDTSSEPDNENTETEIIPDEQIGYFSDIARANRHAKEVYMTWYTGLLRGRENWSFIRHEEQMIEDQLRAYNDMTLWEQENELPLTRKDGSRHMQSMKIWIDTLHVIGPTN